MLFCSKLFQIKRPIGYKDHFWPARGGRLKAESTVIIELRYYPASSKGVHCNTVKSRFNCNEKSRFKERNLTLGVTK